MLPRPLAIAGKRRATRFQHVVFAAYEEDRANMLSYRCCDVIISVRLFLSFKYDPRAPRPFGAAGNGKFPCTIPVICVNFEGKQGVLGCEV